MLLSALILVSSCEPKPEANQGSEIAEPLPDNIFEPGIVSTPLAERDLAISPDGNELFFTIQSLDQKNRIIVRSKREGGSWSRPETALFSGVYNDLEPAYSPDGEKLFFASNRPLNDGEEKADYDIWFVTKQNGLWNEVQNAGVVINTTRNEFYPSIASNGNIYFTASYDDSKGSEDIYLSRYVDGSYQQPVSLDSAINTSTFEFNAFIDPAEKYLIFGSFGRSDGFGGGDMYISFNKDDKWQEGINLGSLVNTEALDFCPFVSSDGQKLYFTSNRSKTVDDKRKMTYDDFQSAMNEIQNGQGNIYVLDLNTVLDSLEEGQ